MSEGRPEIDRELITQLAEDIAADGGHPRTLAFFAANDAPPPLLRWSPGESDVPDGPLRFLCRFWQGHRQGDALPGVDIVEPFTLKPALGYIMLLDVLDEGWDYRYRLYGSAIAQRYGRDLTGRCTSEIARTAYTGIFYIAGYRAVLARREPLFTVSSSPTYVAAADWWRLVLPLSGPDGAIARLLVGNVPGDWRAATAPMPPRLPQN